MGAGSGSEKRSGPAGPRLASLRARADEEPAPRLVLATLRVRIPKGIWVGGFGAKHPDVRIEVLNRGEVAADRSVSDYWISGGPPGVWAREIAGYADVLRVDSLSELAGGCLYRITYRNPPIVNIYRELGIPLVFPTRSQAGYIYWEIAARDPEFRRILAYSRSIDPTASILALRRRPLRSHLPELTDSQQALLHRAMAEGYFAVPRSISLTDLALKLGRSKSAVSEALARIEQRILESSVRGTLGVG